MTAEHVLSDASNIAIWLAAITVLIFLIRYTTLAPWWDNIVGSTIVILDICLELVFIPTCALLADPNLAFFRTIWWRGIEVLAIFVISGVAISRTIAWHIIGKRRQEKRELE